MKHIESKFTGIGNLNLFYQAWLPDGRPEAVVVIIHGVLEHSSRYENMAVKFVSHGFAFYGFDLRGHGKSEGLTGHIDHFSDYRGDLERFLKIVQTEQPGIPVFIYGHSMGAAVCTDFIEHQSDGLKGAIISAAPFEPVGVGTPLLILIAKVMSNIYPRFSANLGLKTEEIFRDTDARKACESDPLMRNAVTARWGTEQLKTVAEIKANSSLIHTPVLIIHGEADKLNKVQGAVDFYSSIPFHDKELKIYPGTFHAMHYDFGGEPILQDVGDWIHRHI